MTSPNPRVHSDPQRWPLTNEAWSALLAEPGRVRIVEVLAAE